MDNQPTSQRRVGAWSRPDSGLIARLVAEPEDLQQGLRYAITLELQNTARDPLAVTNHPQVRAALRETSGVLVEPASAAASGLVMPEQWGVIPASASLAFRIDLQTVGLPARDQAMALVALGDKIWTVRAGTYLLDAMIEYEKRSDAPANQWAGRLDLPQVPIDVSANLFVPNRHRSKT